MRTLPTGTVTFLFTDVEGSTRLLHELGDRYAEVLDEHRRTLRAAFERHGGVEVDTQGDAFFVAFAKASEALAAAAEGRDALASGPIRVRIGLHTGEPLVTDEGYVGIDVHRAARIAAAGHGGQILVSQSTRELVGANGLRDLGEHRLKDLTAPERIYQLGDGDFPRLKSLNQTNLPVQPTPLVGRGQELAEISELLRSSRLLTLTGAGGSGKTRLALQAAAEVVDEFPDGVWFVSLASLTDPQLVSPTIAQVVGARGDLSRFLQGKRLLLLLDNLEQLLPEVAPQIAQLEIPVLATSRERLNIGGEQEYPVPTLPVDDAVALFVQRASQLKPGFEPDEYVTEIARRLDGLPLALELAAARVKVLTPKQIDERLTHSLDLLTSGARDAPERQRTLRGTIDWSYQLLSERERRLLERLSIFVGSVDLEAAETVADADVDILESLIDKSLLRRTEEGRFFMLETVAEFAAGRLRESGQADDLGRRHADFFRSLSLDAARHLMGGPDQTRWLDRLELELGNLRAALTLLRDADPDSELQLATALWPFFWMHRYIGEGHKWLDEGLERTELSHSSRAAALEGASYLAFLQRDIEIARGRAVELQDLTTDPLIVARGLHLLAVIAGVTGDAEGAVDLDQQSVLLLGDDPYARYPNAGLAQLALARGEVDAARSYAKRVLELAERCSDIESVAAALSLFAAAALLEQDYEGALRFLSENLSLEHDLGFTVFFAAHSLPVLAAVLAACRDAAGAACLLGAVDTSLERSGTPLGPFYQRLNDTTIAAIKGAAERAVIENAWSEGGGLTDQEAYVVANDLVARHAGALTVD